MTWKEFKDEVDRQLKEHGVEDAPIHVIDISGYGADGPADGVMVDLSDLAGNLFITV